MRYEHTANGTAAKPMKSLRFPKRLTVLSDKFAMKGSIMPSKMRPLKPMTPIKVKPKSIAEGMKSGNIAFEPASSGGM